MKHSKQLKRAPVILFILLISIMVSGCNIILQWLYAPVKVDYSNEAKDTIRQDLGIEPPENNFVVGYHYPGQESENIYIFSFPCDHSLTGVEQYVRELLGITDELFGNATSIKHSRYAEKLTDLGFAFTHVMNNRKGNFSEICYCIEDDEVQVALICAH